MMVIKINTIVILFKLNPFRAKCRRIGHILPHFLNIFIPQPRLLSGFCYCCRYFQTFFRLKARLNIHDYPIIMPLMPEERL